MDDLLESWTSVEWISAGRGTSASVIAFRARFFEFWAPVSEWTLFAIYLWANDGWDVADGEPPVEISAVGSLTQAVLNEVTLTAARLAEDLQRIEEELRRPRTEPGPATPETASKAVENRQRIREDLRRALARAHLDASRRMLEGYVYPAPFLWADRWCERCLCQFLADDGNIPGLGCFTTLVDDPRCSSGHDVRLNRIRRALASRPLQTSPELASDVLSPPLSPEGYALVATRLGGVAFYGPVVLFLLLTVPIWPSFPGSIEREPSRLLDGIGGVGEAGGRGTPPASMPGPFVPAAPGDPRAPPERSPEPPSIEPGKRRPPEMPPGPSAKPATGKSRRPTAPPQPEPNDDEGDATDRERGPETAPTVVGEGIRRRRPSPPDYQPPPQEYFPEAVRPVPSRRASEPSDTAGDVRRLIERRGAKGCFHGRARVTVCNKRVCIDGKEVVTTQLAVLDAILRNDCNP